MSTDECTALPAPTAGVDVLVIAGEHSGDQHGAQVVRELREARAPVQVAAVGGPALAAEADLFLYDLTRLSVVGLIEVLRHYGMFRKLFNAVLDWIATHRPRVVVLVDYPGFNLRLADELRKRGLSRKGGGSVAVYQYVSPQIWAWKAGRRFKMARVLDELGVIFPFELACYQDTDLDVRFIGHPFVNPQHENPLHYDPDGAILLLPGSRLQAVGRIFPLMLEIVARLGSTIPDLTFVCLYPSEEIRAQLQVDLEKTGLGSMVLLRPVQSGCRAAAVLTSSGTMSLNCALAGIPGAIVYRAHPLTAWIAQRLLSVRYLGIANIILNEPLYQEFLQRDATAKSVACALHGLMADGDAGSRFQGAAERLKQALRNDSRESAAQRINAFL